jgi:glycosyltransferase involved in cell wall biosynthesis
MNASPEPLVSMIMPAWRPRPDWLLEAVNSALGQRDCSFELIVVDDGSPAPVEDLLADVQHPELRVLRVEHGGPSHARNAGIEAARGRLLRFIDADDSYPPDGTARLARLIGNRDDVIAYGRTVFCDEELRPVWTMSSDLEGALGVNAMLSRFTVRIQSLLFPRAVIDATGPWDPSFPVCGDLDFIVRATEHAEVRGDPVVATHYRKHSSSQSSDIIRGDEGVRRMMEGYFERHPELRGSRLERTAAAMRHAIAARAYFSRGQIGQTVRRLARSIALDPRAAVAEARLALPAVTGRLSRTIRPGRRGREHG